MFHQRYVIPSPFSQINTHINIYQEKDIPVPVVFSNIRRNVFSIVGVGLFQMMFIATILLMWETAGTTINTGHWWTDFILNGGQLISRPTTRRPIISTTSISALIPQQTTPKRDCINKCYCGTSQVKRIVGGVQVHENKYPWTAQLIRGRYYARLFCGGSLINDRYVVTAAHCVYRNSEPITVRLLQLDKFAREQGIVRQVKRSIVHPLYDPARIVNDVALLKLTSTVPLNLNMKPICLPERNNSFEGLNATVAGWGLIKEHGVSSSFLQEVTVPIISNLECRNTRYKNRIQDQMLCAGYIEQGGRDACQGDSGGPLIVKEDGHYKLAGLVSFGYGCGQPDAPGVYTRISQFVDWIRDLTSDGCYCGS